MTEINQIADELQRAHDGDPWHGSSIAEILRGVHAERAAARPIPSAHSIWELVLHLSGWVREVTRRLGGARPGYPPEGDFPVVTDVSAAAWATAQASLATAHRELIAAIRALPPSALDAEAGRAQAGSPPISNRQMLHGLAQHDAYHAGQIAILKKFP